MYTNRRSASGRGIPLASFFLICAALFCASQSYAGQITISSLPYTASSNNDTFSIAGTKLTSSGAGITVTGDNVVLNLGSDTVQFGTGVGLYFNAVNNVKVIGGTFLKTGQSGSSVRGIRVYNSNNLDILGTNLIVDGHNAQCVNVDGGLSATYNVNFDGGEWRNNSESFTSRETYSGAVFYSGSFPSSSGNYDVRIANVDITKGPCQGIIVKGQFIIEGCNISTDARNVYWDTVWLDQGRQAPIGQSADNSYLILCRFAEAGTIIRNNNLVSGENYGGSRGILLENCEGTSAKPIEVYNNYCYIHAGPSGENLNGVTRVVRMRAIDGGKTSFIRVYDNTFIGVGDKNNSTTAYGDDVAVMNFGFPNTNDTCIVERNRFIARSLTTGTNVKACESTSGGSSFSHIIRNNHFIGSSTIIYLGDEYNGIAVSNMRFQGDTLSFDSSLTFSKKTWNIGYGGRNSLDNMAVDCKFLNGAADTDINWYSANGGTNEFTLARTLDIQVRGNNSLPVSGASVTVTNNYGQTVVSGTTNSNGRISNVVSYWYDSDDNPDSTNFNNFTIKVKKSSDSTVSSFAVNATSSSPSPVLQNTPGQSGGNNPPTAPTNASPINGDTVNSTPIALRINNGIDPDGDNLTYDFFISTNSSFTQMVDSAKNIVQSPTQTQITFNSFTPTNGQLYYWRVRAYDGTNYSSFSSTSSFWYVNLSSGNECLTPPGAPSVSSPTNGSSVGSLAPSLCVNNSTPASGCAQPQTYSYEIYSDSALTTIASTIDNVAQSGAGTTCATPVFALQPGRFYWWRVRCSNGSATSSWSSVAKFSTPNNVPSTPSPQSPANAASVATLQPQLVVASSSDPDGTPLTYDFQVSSSSSFGTIIRSTTVVGAGAQISWTIAPSLTNGQTYYWRARAKDGIANSNWSATRSFSIDIVTNDPPNAPSIVSPSNGGQVNSDHPTLVAGNATDPNGDALTYQFELYNSTGSTLITSVSGVAQGTNYTSWQVTSTLDNGTSYRWRVRAHDGSEYSSWTSMATFTVQLAASNNPPSTPGLVSPVDDDIVIGWPIVLVMANSIDPDGDPLVYDVQIALDANFNNVVSFGQNVSEGNGGNAGFTQASMLGFQPSEGEHYWWRARARDNTDGQSAWSAAEPFSYTGIATGGDEYIAEATWPVDGETVSDLTPTLRATNITASGNNFYYFDVSTDSNFVVTVANSGAIPEGNGGFTEWTVDTTLINGETYYWRVRANSNEYSDIASFVAGGPIGVSAIEEIYAYPNPICFDDQTDSVWFNLPTEPIELWITTVNGETVRHESNLTSSTGTWGWDGRNESGSKVSFGIYLWTAVSSTTTTSGKIAVKPYSD